MLLGVTVSASCLLSLFIYYYAIPSGWKARRREKAAFREALAAAQSGRFEDAERQFLDFLNRYPDPRNPRRPEASYYLGQAYLEIARRESPPVLALLHLSSRHLQEAARRGYDPRTVARRAHDLFMAYEEAGRRAFAWEAAEGFVDPAHESLAPFRGDRVLLRDRARLAAGIASDLLRQGPPLAAAAELRRQVEEAAERARRLRQDAVKAAAFTERERLVLQADEAADRARLLRQAADFADRASLLAAELVNAAERVSGPTSAEDLSVALRTQAEVAFDTGDPAAVRRSLDRLLALHTDVLPVLSSSALARLYLLRGRAEVQLKDAEAAVRDFDLAVQFSSPTDPAHHEALYRGARELLAQQHPEEAEAKLRTMAAPGAPLAPLAHLELGGRAVDRAQPLRALDPLEAAAANPALGPLTRRFGIEPSEILRRVAAVRDAATEDSALDRVARLLGLFADRFDPESAFRTEEARAYEVLAMRGDAAAARPDISRAAVESARRRARDYRRRAGDRWARLARPALDRPDAERIESLWSAARNFFDARAYAEAARFHLEFTSASIQDPRRSEAFHRAALAAQRLGLYDEAIRIHQHTLDEYPDSPVWTFPSRLEQGLCWLARRRSGEGGEPDVDRARRRFEEILQDDARLNPDSEVWQMALFYLGRTDADLRHAEVLAADGGRADPTSPCLRSARERLTEFLRRYAPPASAPARGTAPPHPYAVPAAWHLGALEQGERRYAAARAAYDTAIALGADAEPPDEDEIVVLALWPHYLRSAYVSRGDCFLAEGKHGEAARAYTEAIERYDLTPERLAGYIGRARARLALGDPPGAERDVHQAEQSLRQFAGYYGRAGAGYVQPAPGAPLLRPYDVWQAEIESVKNQVQALRPVPAGSGGR